jgi:DNA-binding winged helix-turn-helix (wHTH) protein/predicted ATPase
MIYVLGPFRLDTRDNLLFRGNEPLALGRRALALLRAMVERPGALVSKDALIEAAWPGQAVEESNLTVQIASLRRVLGEVPGGAHWIETMPRRGYRFIAPVVAEDANAIAPSPIDATPDPAPGLRADAERRQITVMSCELIGAVGRADGVGLEDLRDAIVAFQRCATETVDRHGGFVFDHLGNAALVLFGYPVAHEHAAEQAVRAGLALCAALSTPRHGTDAPAQCRVGVATGVAIIGERSLGNASEDREIVGDAPNLAMQLRLSAEPGIVVIEPATRRLIGGLFDCRDLGTIDTADGTEPVRVWKVLGESVTVSRFEALRGPALMRLVGREEETSLLLRLWSRAMAGEGQVALVSGEAGLGKSRLTVALAEHLNTEPRFRLRYFCSPHHQNSPLFPVVDQLGRAAGFVHDDTPALRLEKLQAFLARADLPDEDVAFLLDLLVLPMPEGQSLPDLSPAKKKQRILEAMGRQLEGLARQQPVVVIFEDAHWIDATSRELLDMIVERASDLKVLLIVTFRPEFQPPWTGQPRVTTLLLNRLDRRDRIALVEQVAGGMALPDNVITQIVDRTDGVPLFIEEMTKAAFEAGTGRGWEIAAPASSMGLGVPTMLQALLMARLERLGEAAKRVAQIGAAIGRDFSYVLAAAVAELPEERLQEALRRLIDAGLVLQRGAPPRAEYWFKHALVQEAAYNTLLRPTRRQFHARIAAALESLSPELLDTQPELFAQHYTEAGLVEKSVVYWNEAGRRSAAHSAMAEAAAQLRKGLDQLALLPDSTERQRQELELRSSLGAVLISVKGYAAPETGDAYARAREVWEQLGSPSEFLQIPFGQSLNHALRGELDLAERLDGELLRLSHQRGDSAGLILGHLSSGRRLMIADRFASSRSHLEAVLALYDPISHNSVVLQAGSHPHVSAQAVLGVVLFCLGYPDQALVQGNAAIAEARRLGHPPSLALTLAFGALPLSVLGDNAVFGERVEQLVAVATEHQFDLWSAQGTIYRGWVKVRNGDLAEGISLLRSGSGAYRATGAGLWMPQYIDLLAGACEIAGQIQEAVTLLDDALNIVERTGERWLAAELNRHKGQLLLRQGHTDAAEELYRKALSIAEEQGARLWELRAAMSLARLHREQGRHIAARGLLAPIYNWFTEGFGTADLAEANALLARIQAVTTTTEERVVGGAWDGS